MQRRLNVFPFLMTTLMIICKPCSEDSNHQRTRTKFINYLQGFHIKLFRKIPKNMKSVIPRKTLTPLGE